MVGKWLVIASGQNVAQGRVFRPNIRTRLTCALRLAGAACGIEGSHFGSHSLRVGGASAMFAAWYDVAIIKRWGRWPSITSQQYIWHDQYAMSTLGRGIFDAIQRTGSKPGRAGGKHAGVQEGREKRALLASQSSSAWFLGSPQRADHKENRPPTTTGLVDMCFNTEPIIEDTSHTKKEEVMQGAYATSGMGAGIPEEATWPSYRALTCHFPQYDELPIIGQCSDARS